MQYPQEVGSRMNAPCIQKSVNAQEPDIKWYNSSIKPIHILLYALNYLQIVHNLI
jgi:hypothetical protein